MKRADRILNGIAVAGIAGVVAVIGVVAHGQDTWRTEPHRTIHMDVTDPTLIPPTTTTPSPAETQVIGEGDPGWNCLTMGNRECGPEWAPIPEDLYAGLDVSDDEQCMWLVGDTTVIVCSDDQVFTS